MMTTHRIPSRPLCLAPPSKVPGRAAALISSAWNPQILIGFLDMANRVMLVPDLNSWYKTSMQSVLHSKFIWSGNSTKVCLWLPICWFGIWKNMDPLNTGHRRQPLCACTGSWVSCPLVATMGRSMYTWGARVAPWSFKPRHFPGKSPLLPKEMSASTSQNVVYFCWKAGVVWPINSKPILTHTLMFFLLIYMISTDISSTQWCWGAYASIRNLWDFLLTYWLRPSWILDFCGAQVWHSEIFWVHNSKSFPSPLGSAGPQVVSCRFDPWARNTSHNQLDDLDVSWTELMMLMEAFPIFPKFLNIPFIFAGSTRPNG